ncbi:hemerythrin domain-containing protein [Aequorivita xiaoshiensis]|uniref:Hemerythrin domain-containing protein n=1 Tax=Aequorivita xiaoshiensis TaxID=2874476 RepID=A0A9X1QW76_9FLAO|nr:hemerythrin domain-containing protein [Aequorivita xiaoshiensis]MCG2429576.1 hemerythrin domain-containing protein [Aequorivita xiaoshiensis]
MQYGIENKYLSLTPLIKEHDEVILFCERIREGLQRKINSKRIKSYIDWFKETYLDPHFEIEQELIFPILGNNNVRVKRAIANHRRLNRLFDETSSLNTIFHKIEEELITYIGFEERILYQEIQNITSQEAWKEIEEKQSQLKFSDKEWTDRFWEV